MLICRVKGSVISTRKNEKLTGSKFLILESVNKANEIEPQMEFIAVDYIGAGVGETVMVVRGSGARYACPVPGMPVDAAVVGIIDEGTYTP
jgi:ethanolamine utilization protein EutN